MSSNRLPTRLIRGAGAGRCRSLGAIAGVVSLMSACAGAPQGGAQSPERQSDAEYDVARDLLSKGQARSALDHAQKAIELSEENAKALFLASAILGSFCNQDAGLKAPDCKVERAEDYARRAAKADPQFREAKNLLAQVLIWQKKYDEAVQTLDPLTKDPAYMEAHLAWGNMGWALTLSGKLERGLEALKNSVALQPKFCVGNYRLGFAYEKKGELALADGAYTRALEIEAPECKALQDAWEARAHVRLKLGRADESRADYLRCKEISPETRLGKTCMVALSQLPEQK
jgi:type IV pilus assembly protein PilF